MSGYDEISGVYDRINSEVDYSEYAARVVSMFKSYGILPGALIAELGCGTGRMTRELCNAGYDMIGIDNSEGMLSAARSMESDKPDANGNPYADGNSSRPLYLLQDMRSFELYGTVAAAVCFLDGINHLTGPGEIQKCFSLVHNYLDPNGLFLFDLNTPLKFKEEYGQKSYIIDEDSDILLWQNDYNEKRKLCDFYITLMTKENDGRYNRADTWWRERCFSEKYIRKVLSECGFTNIRFFSDDFKSPPHPDAHRWYISAVADKNQG